MTPTDGESIGTAVAAFEEMFEPRMQVVDVLEKGIADGIHVGAQLYVSRDAEPIVDIALGDGRPGGPGDDRR